MRKTLVVLALALGLVAGLAAPAQAVDGRDFIASCSGDSTQCWGLSGLAADVWHEAPSSVTNGGGIVSSIYLYDETTTEFFETGVLADKDLNGNWSIVHFVSHGKRSCGNPCYGWLRHVTNLNFGPWRILLFKTGTDDFTVQWDEPNKARQTLTYNNQLGYYPDNPVSLFSAEHTNDSNGGDPMPDFHKNAWVRNNTGTWYAANGLRRLVCYNDVVDWFHAVRTAGSGSTGDRVDPDVSGAGTCSF